MRFKISKPKKELLNKSNIEIEFEDHIRRLSGFIKTSWDYDQAKRWFEFGYNAAKRK